MSTGIPPMLAASLKPNCFKWTPVKMKMKN